MKLGTSPHPVSLLPGISTEFSSIPTLDMLKNPQMVWCCIIPTFPWLRIYMPKLYRCVDRQHSIYQGDFFLSSLFLQLDHMHPQYFRNGVIEQCFSPVCDVWGHMCLHVCWGGVVLACIHVLVESLLSIGGSMSWKAIF